MKKRLEKGNILIDVALLLIAALISVMIGSSNPIGIGGYVITAIIAYFVLAVGYALFAYLFKLPYPKLLSGWPLLW